MVSFNKTVYLACYLCLFHWIHSYCHLVFILQNNTQLSNDNWPICSLHYGNFSLWINSNKKENKNKNKKKRKENKNKPSKSLSSLGPLEVSTTARVWFWQRMLGLHLQVLNLYFSSYTNQAALQPPVHLGLFHFISAVKPSNTLLWLFWAWE